MSSADKTRNHDVIRRWVEARGGVPAIVKGTDGMLRIDFVRGAASGGHDANLEEVDWDTWFGVFDSSGIAFLYSDDPEGRFFKLVRAEADEDEDTEDSRRPSRRSGGARSEQGAWAASSDDDDA